MAGRAGQCGSLADKYGSERNSLQASNPKSRIDARAHPLFCDLPCFVSTHPLMHHSREALCIRAA